MPVEEATLETKGSAALTGARRAAVVSLHFSPAHASHMIALARLLGELGFTVTFILDEKYLPFAGFEAAGEAVNARTLADPPRAGQFDLAVFCNSAFGNRCLAHQLRAGGASVLYIFHEPESIANLRQEGWRQIVRFPFSTLCSIAMLRVSSAVIVPSACARGLYEKHFLRYNPNVHVMPLLFEDEIGPARLQQMRGGKRFFGYVGTACKSHGFDAFVALARYAISSGSSIPFVIATRTDLTRLLRADNELSRYAREGRIEIHHGRVMSNGEIDEHSLQCFCVWNVYRRSTQSGVLPRALMAGTPVLASRTGSFPEYVREGVTGEFVDPVDSPAAILPVAEKMLAGISRYIDPCRESCLETFHYQANGNRLAAILQSACPGVLDMRVR